MWNGKFLSGKNRRFLCYDRIEEVAAEATWKRVRQQYQ
jgi:hypothetical protein